MFRLNIVVAVLFYIGVVGAVGQNEMTLTADSTTLYNVAHDEFTVQVYNNCCECIEYNCGCCQHIEWNVASLNGTLCANASLLKHDYGISVTLTYNNFTILNETISARNPPPVCFGEDIIDAIEVEICLRIHDISVDCDKFHACFDILGKLAKLPIFTIKLGCVNTQIHEKIQYIKNNTSFHMLPLIFKYLDINV